MDISSGLGTMEARGWVALFLDDEMGCSTVLCRQTHVRSFTSGAIRDNSVSLRFLMSSDVPFDFSGRLFLPSS
jgi:hypothetical protein